MKRTAALTLAAACLALASVGAGSAAQTMASASHVITAVKSINGYRVGAAYTAARQTFGAQYSSTQDRTTCQASWAGGLTIAWHRQLPSANWNKACLHFAWAKVTGSSWRTDRGLRVGAPQSNVKKIYKSAAHKSSGAYTVWTLNKASGKTLQAWAKKGRIAYFKLVQA